MDTSRGRLERKGGLKAAPVKVEKPLNGSGGDDDVAFKRVLKASEAADASGDVEALSEALCPVCSAIDPFSSVPPLIPCCYCLSRHATRSLALPLALRFATAVTRKPRYCCVLLSSD
jgi:hypothetical protein